MEFYPLTLKQNDKNYADDSVRFIFVIEDFPILFQISLNCVPGDQIDNWSELVLVMNWRWIYEMPLH